MAKQQRGCSDWLAGIVILIILVIFVGLAWNPGCRMGGNIKEAEVKQNLHAIQLALERYAVDHDGGYPMFIMGGGWTDSFTVSPSFCDKNELHDSEVELAPAGMGDSLIMEAYMPTFPGNPFKKMNKSKPLLLQHCNHLGEITTRRVGGRDGVSMVEVFGPQYVMKDQAISGDFFVHHIFNNPPYDINDIRKENGVDWSKPSGNELLVGNFSYTPISAREDGCWINRDYESDNETPVVKGYILAGYGSIRTPGIDIYNRNGNYKGRYRTEPCEVDCSDTQVYHDDIPCICPGDGDLEPTMYKNNGGSDTLPDGVVITLDSVVDMAVSRISFEKTEGS